jgi:hypothetical protein
VLTKNLARKSVWWCIYERILPAAHQHKVPNSAQEFIRALVLITSVRDKPEKTGILARDSLRPNSRNIAKPSNKDKNRLFGSNISSSPDDH